MVIAFSAHMGEQVFVSLSLANIEMTNHSLQLLKCEYLQFFSASYNCKLNILGFWAVFGTKQDSSKGGTGIFHCLYTSINLENHCDVIQRRKLVFAALICTVLWTVFVYLNYCVFRSTVYPTGSHGEEVSPIRTGRQ